MATTVTKLQNFIDGQPADSADGATETVVNPATAEPLAEAPVSTAEDVDRAVKAAHRAFESWGVTTPGERSLAMLKLADLVEEHADELADLESADAGKPRAAFLEDEIPAAVDNLRFFASAARNMEGRATGEYLEGYTSMVRREPIGVVGQITPWNYPLLMAVWKIGPALATGNTTVLKPAETTPLSTVKLAELASQVFPKGVFNVVCGHGEPAGSSLVTHPLVEMVSLTGSPAPRRTRSSACTSSWAGRRRWSSSTTWRWRPRWRPSPVPGSTTRARTAPRPRASSPVRRSTTTSCRDWPTRPRAT